ncbi:MAG TPA: molecular chaperone HtpG [Spirochaetota bacterium]|nr:molecular chaperone HtpG [Spirochaetota bacterium]HQO03778.1 molecular chaperone HtpG [Spirochaetota bacterium]
MSTHKFQTEVSQLLQLIIHSLYSHKEIFLRELISNSSDALDKLKYLTFTDEAFKDYDFSPRIDISFDDVDKKTLTIADTGLGMNEEDLVENLGTIARSGTKNFIEKLTGDAKRDSNLIGQFGVGFYSSFMVADSVEVVSRKAGEEKAFRWISNGKGEYEISETTRETAGTTVLLHLNDEGKEFASRWSIESIIKKYSNHIPFPIFLHYTGSTFEGEGDKRKEIKELKVEQVNSASALWKRSKNELTDEDYSEFYKSIAHDTEDPMMHVHTQAEGTLDYTTLFYVPQKAPFDMYYSDYKAGVKLYVKRVFITDDEKELMPIYLRFLRGVIDSEDLPLNVSREILQQNRVLAKIRTSSVKKVLSEFERLAKDNEKYIAFWKEYGRPMKEGLYQDHENRDTLLELVRFKSTKSDGYVSLADYVNRMQPDQNAIYYITGEKEETLRQSPLLEMYNNKEIEVLILDDELDEIVMPAVFKYKEHEFKSVNRSDAAEFLKTDDDREKEKEIEPLIEKIKNALKDRVKDVKASTRLSDSPSCIVVDENDPTVQMQSILKAMGNTNLPDFKPILEINPHHTIILKLKKTDDPVLVENISTLLLEQAMLIEGIKLENPAGFVKKMNMVIDRSM